MQCRCRGDAGLTHTMQPHFTHSLVYAPIGCLNLIAAAQDLSAPHISAPQLLSAMHALSPSTMAYSRLSLTKLQTHGEEAQDARSMDTFLAVVEKQGPCTLQIKPAPDGSPFLCADQTADCAAQVLFCHATPNCHSTTSPQSFRDGINLNCACVRSTKNIRGDFKVRPVTCSLCSFCLCLMLLRYHVIFTSLFFVKHTMLQRYTLR